MPIYAKRFFIGAAIVSVIVAIVLLCVNVYLQSAGVQQRIRHAAEKALGTEVKIRSTIYTPWDGVVLRDLSIPDPTAPQINIVEAAALRVQFAIFPLLQQRFVVTDLSLHSPKMIVRQLPQGDWLVPIPQPAPARPDISKDDASPRTTSRGFQSEIQRFRLLGGYVLFLDAKNRPVMILEKADFTARIAPDRTATGVFDIGNANIADLLKPRRVGGDFVWTGTSLELPDIGGSLANGKITGAAHFGLLPEPSFTLNANLVDVRMKKLAEEAGFDPKTAEGMLNGRLLLKGDPRTSESLEGDGNVELTEGQLRTADFLVQLGTILGIDELQILKLSDARMDFSIRDERFRVDDLFLKSENLILKGKGPIKFDGKMDIDAQLHINRKMQNQFGPLLKNFVESEDPEYRQIAFNVTGKPGKPKTDLLDKVLGMKIGQDFGGLLNNFFRVAPPRKPQEN